MQKIFLLLFVFYAFTSYSQNAVPKKTTDTIQTRIVLIGDAGSLIKGKPSVLNSVKRQYQFDDKTVVVFLGDNLYTYGLPDENAFNYTNIKAALDSQIHLINGTKARAIMIPGNHDWANGAVQGFENVVRQQQYVDNAGNERMNYYPKNGCPGPVEIKLSKDVVLIAMDSQWWLHNNDKPGIESDCDTKTEEEVIDQLRDILNKNYDKLIIVATHHPFKSNGPHGGYYNWKQHFFPFTDLNRKLYIPLPVIGSIYPITRSVFGSHQDISHPKYANMINKIMSAVKIHPNVIMVAGHEHNLQYIKDSNYNYIVSGSGCKENRVSQRKKAEFGKEALGFATLEVSNTKSVNLSFFSLDATKHDSLSQDYNKTILNFSKLPKIEVKDTVTPTFIYKDYVTAPASNKYKKQKWLKRLVNGSNYRAEWSEPITLKVFNINKEKGGLKILGIGGGHQSTSLKLIDKKGKEWVLRTVDKDPEKAIPENLRNTFVSSIVSDMISASHPYAAITTTSIAASAGIIEPTREFFFVPEDKSLGYYLPLFANKVCMLEPREANDEDENKSTFKLMDKMRDNHNTTIDQASVLNARLLDMLLGDWDRHFDQWRWGKSDTGKGKNYYAMPKDRDQAYFNSEGLLVKILGGKLPFVKGFKYDLNTLSQLNVAAKDFDRIFLNGINKHVWDSITVSFLNNVTDEVIRTSIKKLPPEIYKLSGEEIAAKLINRKKQLQKKSSDYYNFISKEVTVTGSNQDELFKVTQNQNNNIVLTGYALDKKEGDSNFIIYQREFLPSITKEVRVFGFNGNDRFVIDSNVATKIKVRFIGGKGNDTFLIKGNAHSELYDINVEQNYQEGKGKHKTHFSSNPNINAYQIRSYQYPKKSLPAFNVSYNSGDGLVAGLGFLFKNYKFRREPFANEHKFISLFAFTNPDFQLKYFGTFNRLIGKTDLLINAKLNNPGFTNFFGLV
jgi:Calcineurin-like phosphoesterase